MAKTRTKTPVSDSPAAALPAIRPGARVSLALSNLPAVTEAAVGVSCIRVFSTEKCFIVIGPDPVADTTGTMLAAESPEYFCTNPDDKVAALIRGAATTGTLQITKADEAAP